MQMDQKDQEKLKDQFIKFLSKAHPDMGLDPEMISPHMLSPLQISLPESVLLKVKNFAETLFSARCSVLWQNHFAESVQHQKLVDPGNFGILMSYDFHIDENQIPKLIEINTNASFLALGSEFYRMLQVKGCDPTFQLSNLIECIQQEKRLFDLKHQRAHQPVRRVCIVDEQPHLQKLFVEFRLYQSFFRQNDIECEIASIDEIDKIEKADLVYNRYTDFYLKELKSQHLQELYLNSKQCFSPNPFEYFQLADKKRLEEWTDPAVGFFRTLPGWEEHVQPLLLASRDLNEKTAVDIWENRKKYFMKPRNSFGAKQSYRGSSISRGLFDSLIDQNMIAQEFCPAPNINVETDTGNLSLKYDLRFYVYQNQVQFCIGRVYQGQVTNLRTPLGGFAPVFFSIV